MMVGGFWSSFTIRQQDPASWDSVHTNREEQFTFWKVVWKVYAYFSVFIHVKVVKVSSIHQHASSNRRSLSETMLSFYSWYLTKMEHLWYFFIIEHQKSELTLYFAIVRFFCMKSSPKVMKNQWFYQKVQNLLGKAMHIFLPAGHRRK